MTDLYLKEEAYKVIGCCMEVHKILGKGHSEIIYGDALEYEFKRNFINYSRETQYNVTYKDVILPHYYFADFVLFDEIILEIKAISELSNSEIRSNIKLLGGFKKQVGIIGQFWTR